jgi:hypothetical protein
VATIDVTALQRSDLNAFLFADVGTKANGMILSVASVLARQGNDPWREAGRLADLPKSEATDSLARTIAGMPRSLWGLPDAVVIAVRLTGLLPARPARGPGRVVGRPAARTAVVLACIALAFAYAFMATMQSSPPARSDGGDVASFASPAAPPAPGDQQREGKHR